MATLSDQDDEVTMMANSSAKWAAKTALFGGAVALGVVSGIRARRDRAMSRVAGLQGSVTINRDRLGIPYIIAASWEDATFGLGFAHAEDRLWQMDLSRRVAMGELSAIIGSDGL
jgi:penicillin amidase